MPQSLGELTIVDDRLCDCGLVARDIDGERLDDSTGKSTHSLQLESRWTPLGTIVIWRKSSEVSDVFLRCLASIVSRGSAASSKVSRRGLAISLGQRIPLICGDKPFLV
jgi:hypothetical protein